MGLRRKVQVRASNTVTSGTMSFQLSVGGDLAPVVQIMAFCILPSENVVQHLIPKSVSKNRY